MITIKINSTINERETDIIYGKIANFFSELLENPTQYFKINLKMRRAKDGFFPAIILNQYNFLGDKQKDYETFLKNTGDQGKVIRSLEHYVDMMNTFQVVFLPKEADVTSLGSMNALGIMTIYLPKWDEPGIKEVEYYIQLRKSQGADLNILKWPDEYIYFIGEERTKKLESVFYDVVDGVYSNYVEDTINHEIAHYINSIRSSGAETAWNKRKIYRDKNVKKYSSEEQKYANSTEEFQARFSQLFAHFSKILKEIKKMGEFIEGAKEDIRHFKEGLLPEDIQNRYVYYFNKFKSLDMVNNPSGEDLNLLYVSILKNDITEFSKFFNLKTNFYHYKNHLTQKSINRYKSRLYSAFESFKQIVNSKEMEQIKSNLMYLTFLVNKIGKKQ